MFKTVWRKITVKLLQYAIQTQTRALKVAREMLKN